MEKVVSLITLIAVMALASAAFASQFGNAVPFSIYSGTSATHYSSVWNVRGFKEKTVTVDMTTVAATGTLLVQCGPTASGPWTTCVQEDGTAVTGTSSYILSWVDASAYIRASWARTTGKISTWFNWSE